MDEPAIMVLVGFAIVIVALWYALLILIVTA